MHGPIRFSLTADDYVTATRLHMTREFYRSKLIKLTALMGLFYAALVFLTLGQWTWQYAAIAAGLGAVAAAIIVLGIAVTNHIMIARRSRRIYAQQKSLHDEFEFFWDETAFNLATQSARSRHNWADFRQWAEGPDAIILYQSDALFNMLPKRAFPEEALADIRERLSQAKVRQLTGWR
ncbi:YcxB family protein [Sphingomonas sp. BT-65]|uniref:YcxB family protein n=1 Tax=Sphingomonas sp. BT-65 TaxID=2989821 RepID=UPI0022356093|nr:YcxB family protein [Sphingomonas sp. BT-65]MCW4462277.1 YcxB family protein [Sphingomonas sp. BT-65]